MLGYIVSISAPDEATLKEESYSLQCTTAGPYNAMPTDLLRAGFVFGLGSDVHGIPLTSLGARFRTAALPLHSQMAQRKSGLPVDPTMFFFELTRLHWKRGS